MASALSFFLIHINQNDPAGYSHQSIYKESSFAPFVKLFKHGGEKRTRIDIHLCSFY